MAFTSNNKQFYDIYAKGYKLICSPIPKEAEEVADFQWGWYDPGKDIYQRYVEVDTFEEGSHTLYCSSPNSTAPPLKTTFLVIREWPTSRLHSHPILSRLPMASNLFFGACSHFRCSSSGKPPTTESVRLVRRMRFAQIRLDRSRNHP